MVETELIGMQKIISSSAGTYWRRSPFCPLSLS
jgi:hypothetical protein